MLLGIVLHGALAYVHLPIWPAQDLCQNTRVFGLVQHAIHGFRMPLFFLLSGFFTAMLWRRRGLRALIAHRVQRILIPLVVALVIVWPCMIVVGMLSGPSKAWVAEKRGRTGSVWMAAKQGDLKALEGWVFKDSLHLNERDAGGTTPLGWAALSGHADVVAWLLEQGADAEKANFEGSTPLHGAVFFGRDEVVRQLLQAGADPQPTNVRGETPLDTSKGSWTVARTIAGVIDIRVQRDDLERGRAEIEPILRDAIIAQEAVNEGSKPPTRGVRQWETIRGLYALGAWLPIFHHLWFLYYLCLLVALFVPVVWLVSRGILRCPDNVLIEPWRWLWVLPLTYLAQVFMKQTFGPDTAAGLLPWPPKLLYYAIFFGCGAIAFTQKSFKSHAGKRWPLCIALAVPSLIVGLHYFEQRTNTDESAHYFMSLAAVLYAWLMVYGCIGFFRQFFGKENVRLRYLSDAAYWLYLAHLPLILWLQQGIAGFALPSGLKFLFVSTATIAILLLAYEHLVRYTAIGAFLNGKKARRVP